MPKDPRAMTATAGDLMDLKAQLLADIEAVRSLARATPDDLASAESKLRGEIAQAQSVAASNVSDAKDVAAASVTKLESHVDRLVEDLRAQMAVITDRAQEALMQVREELMERLAEIDVTQIKQDIESLFERCRLTDENFNGLEQDLANLRGDVRSLAEDIDEQRRCREAMEERLRNEIAASGEKSDGRLKTESKSLTKALKHQAATLQAEDAKLNDEINRVGRLLAGLKSQVEDDEEQAANTAQFVEQVQNDANAAVITLRQDMDGHVNMLNEKNVSIMKSIAANDNILTSKFTWVIVRATDQIKGPQGDDPRVSYFSPVFDAGGAHDLRLELRLYKDRFIADTFSVAGQGVNAGPEADCAIYFHGSKGYHMMIRIHIGRVSQLLDAAFDDHTTLVGTKPLCLWKEEVNPNTRQLQIAVEILECTTSAKGLSLGSAFSFEGAPSPEPAPEGSDPTLLPPDVEGKVVFQRCVKHNTVEQVKQQVDHMRACMVRKVEWRIEQPLTVCRHFPRGQSVKSLQFDAAGVEGLQFIFYPGGYEGASDGYCSLYLKAQAGVSLKGWLQVGSERREADYTFDKDGMFGRTNFCRFTACGDPSGDDCILVTLEIDEAYQDLHARAAHAPYRASLLDTFMERKLNPFESIVKLSRSRGRLPANLQSVKVLPALLPETSWTDGSAKMDGRHTAKIATRSLSHTAGSRSQGAIRLTNPKRGETPSKGTRLLPTSPAGNSSAAFGDNAAVAANSQRLPTLSGSK